MKTWAETSREDALTHARYALMEPDRLRERLVNDMSVECSRKVCYEPEVRELAAIALVLLDEHHGVLTEATAS